MAGAAHIHSLYSASFLPPCVAGHVLPWRTSRSGSKVPGRLGGTLGPLHHRRTLLPTQQFVVFKETFIAGDAMGAVGEGQQTLEDGYDRNGVSRTLMAQKPP